MQLKYLGFLPLIALINFVTIYLIREAIGGDEDARQELFFYALMAIVLSGLFWALS